MNYYRQCLLKQKDREALKIAWIPEEFAKAYYSVTLKEDDFKIVWIVQEVYHPRIQEDLVRELERDHLTQRKASDI